MQIYSQFYKTDTIEVFYSLQSTKPENFRSKTWATRHHAPPEGLEISASMNTHSHAPPSSFTHSHTLVISHALTRAMMSSSTNQLTRLSKPTRFDPFILILTHSVFCVHSDFGIHFFVRDSEIVQIVQFPKKLTFAQILTKSQNFQKGPVLPNFSRRFRFWGLFLKLLK